MVTNMTSYTSGFYTHFSLQPYLICLSLSLALVVGWVIRGIAVSYFQRAKMPPGPAGIPILGNVLQVPSKMAWIRFTEWQAEYGPIFSLNLAGQPVVVLNTHQVTADLLDRRSNIYSDRPRLIMASEILTGGIFIVFAAYGAVWRKMRRASHEGFNARASEQYQPIQAKQAMLTVLGILKDPDCWEDYIRQATASNILTVVYGWPRIGPKDKPLIKRIHAHTARIASSILPGAYLVELFPIMKHLPTWMANWKREGLEWHEQETKMFEEFNAGVSERLASGDSKPCFVSSLIENEKRHGLSKKEAAWLSGIMFSAGAETIAVSLNNFILAMTLNPDVMRKAQAELDAVVGRDRIPTFADKDNLPYIRAIVKETLRWRPVSPLAVPRRVTEDDWYGGYFIPKGTTVISNIWAMNRDPNVFPDFDEFRPERFLDKTGRIEVIPPDTRGLGHVSFGFGRRMCAGANFASQEMFIDIASILWAFNIEKAVDSDGNVITPSKADCIDAGAVVGPVPFRCSITPRSPDISFIMERELGDHPHHEI